MDIVVTSAGMRACDRYAARRLGIPSALLMENAAREVARAAGELLDGSGSAHVAIVCGRGHNGGDGMAAARHLLASGRSVHVHLVGSARALKGEPARQYAMLRAILGEAGDRLRISEDPSGSRLVRRRDDPGAIVDALVGTGFRGELRGGAAAAARWINRRPCPVVSVDLPSGLDADSGAAGPACVEADVTVTMGLRKAGLYLGRGPAVCGTIRVADLGVPMPPSASLDEKMYRVTAADAASGLPARPRDAHKHSVGTVLVLAGSVGLTGAARLSAAAAMRSGAGAVVLAVPEAIYGVLARTLTEIMVKPVAGSAGGTFSAASLDALEKEIDWADVIVVGPGVGRTREAAEFMKSVLKMRGKRFLLDADGLNLLAGDTGRKAFLRGNTCILTPHAGEFGRLTGLSPSRIASDPLGELRKFARAADSVVVLKGAPTITAGPKGALYINSTGNPGMATAGTGDVLAGMIAAFWAGSDDAAAAARSGVYFHGAAGDRLAERFGIRSLMAGDILKELPYLLNTETVIGVH